MLLPNTVFVLGAAVSKEFGMPLGGVLKGMIRNALKDNARAIDDLHDAIYGGGFDTSQAAIAIKHIAEAMLITASIDNLVEHVKSNPIAVRIAKLAIATCILQAEADSAIYVPDRKFGFAGKVYDTTLGSIFRMIIGNVPVEDLEEAFSRVKFITFNYDRSLEWFLLNALISHSGIDQAQAVKLVNSMSITHAYGSIGELAYLATGGSGIDYGGPITRNRIIHGADRIKTFSEERDSPLKDQIDSVMGAVHRIIILGCYPHPQNLELLRPPEFIADDIYMTTYIPAPADPDGLSSPSMVEFTAPERERLAVLFKKGWKRPRDRQGSLRQAIEPMTSLQMVAKYGSTGRQG